ncbi:formylglycine-generating enzyme required for sulfatase activity [Brevundimonas nasdae]|uniref:SUMF1/EgtB/PvdO family nonheme iron enzyme n=1 Tax=Brevundimonas nasdae TaxID=172043 RepID=UPI001F1F54BA|nr:SUMF1/EgtB/PvdO family nonheme iron enzyme [Brevundimonas nasdae]MDQ0452314.1 formylglycine-generating enzyme required for sulfatase activity [Brevundimonas nasdae]
MRRLEGGLFVMGCETFYPEEAPLRPVRVGPYWIDETPVTNAQFAAFVEKTGHVTLAEIAPDPAAYPGMDPALDHPGSLVFNSPASPVRLDNPGNWWDFASGPIGAAPRDLAVRSRGARIIP